jgi:hypothetical protein
MTRSATPATMPYTHSVALLERRVLVFIEVSFLARCAKALRVAQSACDEDVIKLEAREP